MCVLYIFAKHKVVHASLMLLSQHLMVLDKSMFYK